VRGREKSRRNRRGTIRNTSEDEKMGSNLGRLLDVGMGLILSMLFGAFRLPKPENWISCGTHLMVKPPDYG
jgi:hypothetical protein